MFWKINKFFSYFIFLFLGLFLIRLPIGNFGSINFLDILIILFLGLFFHQIIKERKVFLLKQYFFSRIVVFLLVLLFFMGILFSSIFGNVFFDGLGLIKSFFVLPILFALVIDFLIKTKSKLSSKKSGQTASYLFFYFLYASFLAIVGLVYWFFDNLTYDGRLKIFFDSPNQLAISLSPGIIIGLFFLIKKERDLAWFFVLFFTLFQLISLWKTASLGAWIGLFACLFFVCLARINFLKMKWALIFVLFFSLCLVGFIFSINSFSISTNPSHIPSSTDSRSAIFQSGSRMIEENFFLGIGIGNFQEKYLSFQEFFPPYPQWAVPHFHNMFLHIWAEAGFLSFVAFFGLIFYQIISLKNKKTPLLLGAILIYFLVHGFFDVPIWKNDSAVLFWLALLLL